MKTDKYELTRTENWTKDVQVKIYRNLNTYLTN